MSEELYYILAEVPGVALGNFFIYKQSKALFYRKILKVFTKGVTKPQINICIRFNHRSGLQI